MLTLQCGNLEISNIYRTKLMLLFNLAYGYFLNNSNNSSSYYYYYLLFIC